MKKARISKWLVLAALMGPSVFAADKPQEITPHPGWGFTQAGLIPIESGGRVKPLDTFARESVLFTTGGRSFGGWKPVDLLFSWISVPQLWDRREFIEITRRDVKRQLGLEESRKFFAPRELVTNAALAQYAGHISGGAGMSGGMKEEKGPAAQREKELRAVLQRLGLFRQIVSGDAWTVVPRRAPKAWLSLDSQDKDGDLIHGGFVELIHAYIDGDVARFDQIATLTRAAVEMRIPGWGSGNRRVMATEYIYNKARPFLAAWILYLLAALALGASLAKGAKGPKPEGALWRVGQVTLGLGFFCHVVGIGMRCYIAGRPPVTNMYESIMWVSLGVVVFALVIYALQRQAITLVVAAVLATFGLIAGDAAPAMLDPGLNPLVPVLRSNYWLTIHVLTITLGYAAFALTLGLANVTLYRFWVSGRDQKTAKTKIATMNQLTYRAMQFGVVLLAAGTILGGVWADYSWGRFWGWDPKEVWALIALLGYLAVLHARYAGWAGQFGFAAWSVVGFLSVVMSWYGVNFVLGVGLHSYGFSTGGRGWVAAFVSAQLLYVIVIAMRHYGVGWASLMGKGLRPRRH